MKFKTHPTAAAAAEYRAAYAMRTQPYDGPYCSICQPGAWAYSIAEPGCWFERKFPRTARRIRKEVDSARAEAETEAML